MIFFITFRLADSLPQEKLQALTKQRSVWSSEHPEPADSDKKEFSRQRTRQVLEWLDAGYGSMILKRPDARTIVENAIRHFDGQRYDLDEFVVAPNHVHVLVAPREGFEMLKILHSWKSYSAKALLKLPGIQETLGGPAVWQRESWDHMVRSEASLEKFRRYIRNHKD